MTSADVVYTIGVLHDADYTGPLAAAWSQVTATAIDPLTVQFDLGDPVGGFLQAATLPLMPAHILADVPVAVPGSGSLRQSPHRERVVRPRRT